MTDTSSTSKIEASRSIYYSLTDDVPGLTEEEKLKLEAVMKKAQEFEAEEANKMRQPTEGQLYKYTNVMKGWQYRWFILTPDTGMLEYYMLDERKKSRPRGAIHLGGAIVTPSDEDNQSFSVSGICGEVFKLKATDAKDRQFWVNKIRSVIETAAYEDPSVSLKTDSPASVPQPSFAFCKSSSTFHVTDDKPSAISCHGGSDQNLTVQPEMSKEKTLDSLNQIKESVAKAAECQKVLAMSIENLPFSGPSIKCSDRGLLLIKAVSQANVQSLEQCYLILRRHRPRSVVSSKSSVISTNEEVDKTKSNVKKVF